MLCAQCMHDTMLCARATQVRDRVSERGWPALHYNTTLELQRHLLCIQKDVCVLLQRFFYILLSIL